MLPTMFYREAVSILHQVINKFLSDATTRLGVQLANQDSMPTTGKQCSDVQT